MWAHKYNHLYPCQRDAEGNWRQEGKHTGLQRGEGDVKMGSRDWRDAAPSQGTLAATKAEEKKQIPQSQLEIGMLWAKGREGGREGQQEGGRKEGRKEGRKGGREIVP